MNLVNSWIKNTIRYFCVMTLIATLIVVPLSTLAEEDIKVKATMNKQGRIAIKVLNNSGQDIYTLQIISEIGMSNPKGGKGWKIEKQGNENIISFVTDSSPIKNGMQKKFYIYYKGSEKSITFTWIAKGKSDEKILEGSMKVINRYEGIIEVRAKPLETAFDLIINNKSFKNVGTVGMAIWSPFGDTLVENVVTPTGWSYSERELVTPDGSIFNGILIVPDREEDFIVPNSKNTFKIDLSLSYDDYCIWLVSYTLFDTNDVNTQKVIKNGFLNVQNPSCYI